MSELAREEDLAGKLLDRRVVRRLFAMLGPYRRRILLVLGCELALVSTIAVRPWFFAHAIDHGFLRAADGSITGIATGLVLLLGFGIAALWAVRFAIDALSEVQSGSVAIDLLADLRRRIAEHVHRLSVGYFDRTRVGRVVARADRDVETLEPLLIDGLPQLAATGLRFAVACTLLGVIAPDILWRLLLVAPVLLGAIWLFKQAGTALWGRVAEAKSRVTAHLVESIQGVGVIQQAVAEEHNRTRYRSELHALDRRMVTSAFGWAWFPPFTFVLFTVGLAIALLQGGSEVAAGSLTLGEMTQCVFYVFLFLGPLMELGDLFERAADAGAAARRIFLLLDTPAEVVDRDEAHELDAVRGDLRFEDERFAYRADTPVVLPDFSLHIPAGQTCAVVGPTGHGKSTMVQLLARFYDVQGGAVRIDGHDVRDCTQRSLRRHVGIVLQDNVLFSGSVLDNLRVARPQARDEELIAACHDLGADHVLERLPAGYHTEVGSEGSALSHGCRQLVCLVRAYLADPAVLVLDEATSAIDLYTERRLQRALRRLVAGRTAVIIAHRLATVRDADRIVVIRDGAVAEDGDHASLVAAGGVYADLYAAYREGERV